ncbi:Uncharacterised protein [Vibrio cholerae]|nr:Uncharacterised protein [Vibrio cholerae]CSB52960.1 Uncharacterised protein [Vibrio cholerae]
MQLTETINDFAKALTHLCNHLAPQLAVTFNHAGNRIKGQTFTGEKLFCFRFIFNHHDRHLRIDFKVTGMTGDVRNQHKVAFLILYERGITNIRTTLRIHSRQLQRFTLLTELFDFWL